MRFAKQFWKIIGWSFASAWVLVAFILIGFDLFKGWRLATRPELFPIGSEALSNMDLATSTLASVIAFWLFIGILGIGAILGIILTIYEWFRYKRFPLLPTDKVEVLKSDINKRLTQVEQDIGDLKKSQDDKWQYIGEVNREIKSQLKKIEKRNLNKQDRQVK